MIKEIHEGQEVEQIIVHEPGVEYDSVLYFTSFEGKYTRFDYKAQDLKNYLEKNRRPHMAGFVFNEGFRREFMANSVFYKMLKDSEAK